MIACNAADVISRLDGFSVYPPGAMLEMSNGYPPSGSPLGGSPSPGPSPALGVGGGSANKGSNPSRHSPQPPPPPPPPHPHRTNLRVVIPTPLTQPLSDDTSYDVSAPGKEEYAKKAVHSRSELVRLAEYYAYNWHLSVIIYNSDCNVLSKSLL